jgi:glycosyltransferase involved in cell wall biosynthesis
MELNAAPQCGGKRLKQSAERGITDPPLISIVTVVLNAATDLEVSIRSVIELNQNNVEYVIMDGGSTDGTLDILQKYEDSVDFWMSEPDKGIYDAMNKAVRLAHGRWVCILGADDTLCSNLATVASYLKDERTIYYGDVFMTGSQRRYDGPFGAWKLSRHNICQQAIFYPRAAFESQQFDLKYRLLADWEFNMRCFANPSLKFQHIPVLVANYNDTTGTSSVGSDRQFQLDHGKLIREYLPWPYYAWNRFKSIARPLLRRKKIPR